VSERRAADGAKASAARRNSLGIVLCPLSMSVSRRIGVHSGINEGRDRLAAAKKAALARGEAWGSDVQ
jgi:hypothetical protein